MFTRTIADRIITPARARSPDSAPHLHLLCYRQLTVYCFRSRDAVNCTSNKLLLQLNAGNAAITNLSVCLQSCAKTVVGRSLCRPACLEASSELRMIAGMECATWYRQSGTRQSGARDAIQSKGIAQRSGTHCLCKTAAAHWLA